MTLTYEFPTLAGASVHDGIAVTGVGDDGDVFVALGHHDDQAVIPALLAEAKKWGWTSKDISENFDDDEDIADRLCRTWAKMLTDSCGRCNDKPDCSTCEVIRSCNQQSDGWWMDYDQPEGAPGCFPVTVLNLDT